MGFIENLGIDFNQLYSEFQAVGIAAYLIGLAVCLLFALYGYKLQKICIALSIAFGAATLSLNILSKFIEDQTTVFITTGIIALIVFILIYSLYIKIISFVFGIAGGAIIYMTVAPIIAAKVVEASDGSIALLEMGTKIVVTILGAVMCGILAKFVFKWCVIIATSLVGAFGAIVCCENIVSFIMQKPLNLNIYITLALGILLGIVCCVVQIKKNRYSN